MGTKTTFGKFDKPESSEAFLETFLQERFEELARSAAGYTSYSLTGLSGSVTLPAYYARSRTVELTGTPAGAVTLLLDDAAGANADLTLSNVCAGSTPNVTVKSAGANTGNPSGVTLSTGFTRAVRQNGESVFPVTNEAARTASSGLNSGLVAFWKLDEVSGTRSDSVGANHLTDNNTVTQATGKVGTSAQFTAANSESLSIADNAPLSTGDIDFTVCAWVWLDTKGAVRDLVTKFGASGQFEYLLNYDSSADRYLWGVSSDGSLFASVSANTFGSPPAGAWHFVVAYHDSVNNLIGISVNNGAFDTAAHAAGVFDSAASFHLGGRASGPNYHNGRLDAVGLWKRVLSAAEITSLYNSGNGREYPF